jgi:MORN repeat variant
MIKIMLLTFFPFLCFAQTDTAISRDKFVFKGPISYNPNPKLISNANREWKDSLNFIVVRGKYISGALFNEILEDKNTKTYYWKQFYENGQLKEVGAMTKDEKLCFGKWTCYFENGKIDTTIDYDKMLLITYPKALEIANSNGFKMPDLDIDIVTNDNRQYWQIRKWIMKNGDGISSTILISTKDGSLKKAIEEVERHN